MQLGTRWKLGDTPPASVPASVHPLIEHAESTSDDHEQHWTLTWLEGRAIATLDDGTTVRDGHVIAPGQDIVVDDEW